MSTIDKNNPEAIYLEYCNDWLTTERMAEYYQINQKELLQLINKGREINHSRPTKSELRDLCYDLKEELKGFNRLVCEHGIQSQKYKDIVLTFGQQAVADAPNSMKVLLKKETYKRLCDIYLKLTRV